MKYKDKVSCFSWWLALVGSLKLQVSFAKEPYKRDYSLQERPIHLGILLFLMASMSRLLKIIGLFCKRTLSKRLYSAKEIYTFRYPAYLDGCCSTVQGLLAWVEVDLGFPELFVFRLICVLSVFFCGKWLKKISCAYRVAKDARNMRWLRLVGFFKLWVSFAKEPYKRDYILQKRSRILRSLLIGATPYLIIIGHFPQNNPRISASLRKEKCN